MTTETEDLETRAIELRRAYQREWRKKNKDKVKEYERKKWIKKAIAASEQGKSNDNCKD